VAVAFSARGCWTSRGLNKYSTCKFIYLYVVCVSKKLRTPVVISNISNKSGPMLIRLVGYTKSSINLQSSGTKLSCGRFYKTGGTLFYKIGHKTILYQRTEDWFAWFVSVTLTSVTLQDRHSGTANKYLYHRRRRKGARAPLKFGENIFRAIIM